MTLNDFFTAINGMVRDTNTVINALTDPNRARITRWENKAKYYVDTLVNTLADGARYIDKMEITAIKYLYTTSYNVIREFDTTISEIRQGVDTAFTQFYNNITYKLESAIGFTYNEIQESETFLMDRMDKIAPVIINRMKKDLGTLETKLMGEINTLKGELENEESSLWERILKAAGEAKIYVTEQVTNLTTIVEKWVDDLWKYIGTVVTDLATKFNQFYKQITDWVGDSLGAIGRRITTVVSTLTDKIMDYYKYAKRYTDTAKAWLVSQIDKIGITLRKVIDTAIEQVKDLLGDLALLTDWNFKFFKAFLLFPELSFLEVLNRDDETFNKFKPYWQALFARVMEEE